MDNALKLAARYRIVLNRAEDQTFIATCAELAGPSARALGVDAAVKALRQALARELLPLIARGDAPTPLRDSEGRMGAWMTDLELISMVMPASQAVVEKPIPSAMHAIAQWTIDRYRIVLEEHESDGFAATSPEMPEILAHGWTPARAAADLRWRLEDRAFSLLNANRLPPEPLQDIEAREGTHANLRLYPATLAQAA